MLISSPSQQSDYYQALLDRNQKYIGIFYAGVKTTSIFCISTCSARKPKFENVEFFSEMKDALDNGYRACKICKPTENAYESPDYVERAIQLMKANPKQKIKDFMLRSHDISPEKLRRWFKKNYGITFHTYQRMFRINSAYHELRKGKNATSTAFDSGYDSLSGFGYTYKKILGAAPSQKSNNIILINRLTTPLGPMFVCATSKGICLLEFVDRKMLETEFKDLQQLLQSTIITGENEHIIQLKNELQEYFDGKRKSFSVALDTPGTVFQNKVWKALREISFGETSSYHNLALQLQCSDGSRAVARANGFNRISIVVPCHRVIGSDGNLKGYGGGLHRKRWLLNFESQGIGS